MGSSGSRTVASWPAKVVRVRISAPCVRWCVYVYVYACVVSGCWLVGWQCMRACVCMLVCLSVYVYGRLIDRPTEPDQTPCFRPRSSSYLEPRRHLEVESRPVIYLTMMTRSISQSVSENTQGQVSDRHQNTLHPPSVSENMYHPPSIIKRIYPPSLSITQYQYQIPVNRFNQKSTVNKTIELMVKKKASKKTSIQKTH